LAAPDEYLCDGDYLLAYCGNCHLLVYLCVTGDVRGLRHYFPSYHPNRVMKSLYDHSAVKHSAWGDVLVTAAASLRNRRSRDAGL